MIKSRGKIDESSGKFEFICQRDENLQFICNNINVEIKDHNYANIENGFVSKTLVDRHFHQRINSLHFLIDGEAQLRDSNKTMLKSGDVFLVGQNIKCEWEYTKPSREITVIFNMYLGNLDDLFESLTEPLVISGQNEKVKIAENLFLEENPLSVLKFRNLYMEYLIDFLPYVNLDFKSHIELTKKYAKIYNYITDNLSIGLNINKIAQNTNYSVNFFTKNFVKDNGITVKEYIHSKVMAEIEQRLITTDDTFSEIAERYKFCELAYFTRWFKKNKNCTPSEYRKRMRALRQNSYM